MKKQNFDAMVSLRIKYDDLEVIISYARERSMTLSQLIRTAILKEVINATKTRTHNQWPKRSGYLRS